jgi:dihydroorotate dehydrogenase
MVYEGPGLPARIVRGLSAICDHEKLGSIRDLRDSRVGHWADMVLRA